jgi:hypothetical protein
MTGADLPLLTAMDLALLVTFSLTMAVALVAVG